MRKLRLLILIIISMVFLSACNMDDINIKDKISAPDNNKPPIVGKWEIKYNFDGIKEDKELEDEELKDIEGDEYIGRAGLFHKDAVIIGDNYATEPTFKIKNVDASDYLLYKYKTSPKTLNIEQKEIQIVTILNDNQYFYEFIKLDDGRLITYINDEFYLLEKIIDEVSIEEINRYIDIQKSMIRTFDTIEAEKIQTGVLLGIKTPSYDEVNEISQWEYKTIWINSQDQKITHVYEVEDLLLPRKNGFWMINMEREISKGGIVDVINATPKFTLDKDSEEDELFGLSEAAEMPKSPKAVLRNILFLGNNYISTEKIDIDSNKRKTLEIYALDNIKEERPIKLSDIIGSDGNQIFKDGAENILSLESAKLDESNMALDRKNGYWVFEGRVNYKQNDEELYKDFDIKAIPPVEIVSFDEMIVPWNMIKSQIPQALDVFSSPNGEFIIVVTHANLLIYPISNGELINKEPVKRIPIPDNSSIIMSEWAVGKYTDTWQNEFIKNGGEIMED